MTPVVRKYTVRDAQALTRLWSRPEVYRNSSDDNCDPGMVERYALTALTTRGAWLVGSDPATNSFLFVPLSSVHAVLHLSILDTVADRHVLGRAAVGWCFTHTPFRAITAMVPIRPESLHVRLFAAACGFRPVGTLERSFLRGGALLDQRVYHGTRDEYQQLEDSRCRK